MTFILHIALTEDTEIKKLHNTVNMIIPKKQASQELRKKQLATLAG